MDGWTFVATMTTALAWPMAVAALSFAFRKEIRDLLRLLKETRRLKLGPLEAVMVEHDAEKVLDLAQALPPPVGSAPADAPLQVPDASSAPPQIEASTAAHPLSDAEHTVHPSEEELRRWNNATETWTASERIRFAWEPLARSICLLAMGFSYSPGYHADEGLRLLEAKGVLPGEDLLLLRELNDIHRKATRSVGGEITLKTAESFERAVKIARARIKLLRSV
jgi:hypothetical protein